MCLFELDFSPDVCSGSGVAGSHGNSIFSFFKEPPYCSIAAAPVDIPTNRVGGLPFLHPLSSIYYW